MALGLSMAIQASFGVVVRMRLHEGRQSQPNREAKTDLGKCWRRSLVSKALKRRRMELEGVHASFGHKLKVVNHIATVSRPRIDVAPSCKRAFGMLLTFWDAVCRKGHPRLLGRSMRAVLIDIPVGTAMGRVIAGRTSASDETSTTPPACIFVPALYVVVRKLVSRTQWREMALI